jgi:glycosyltransferase involved in cell wall biosynthesis
MKILFPHIRNTYKGKEIITYTHSIARELRIKGHEVIECSKDRLPVEHYKQYDLLLDIDCGRDLDQSYKFHLWDSPVPCKSAVILVDTHGKPDEHQRLSRHADHVFFAVWDKRDLFSDHKSAHWLPNFTDLKHFNSAEHQNSQKIFDFCFFGSKGGLDRADMLKAICEVKNWKYDIDEVGRKGKHRWPRTAERMAACRFAFNHGQKHDGPNLRVMESMAMGLPLICDQDKRDGKGYLFEPWQHYIPYEAYTYDGLEQRMQWCIDNPEKAAKIAEQAYKEVCNNHLAVHRVEKILEVVV